MKEMVNFEIYYKMMANMYKEIRVRLKRWNGSHRQACECRKPG